MFAGSLLLKGIGEWHVLCDTLRGIEYFISASGCPGMISCTLVVDAAKKLIDVVLLLKVIILNWFFYIYIFEPGFVDSMFGYVMASS